MTPQPLPWPGAALSEHMRLLEDCEQRESRLTDWDRAFLDSARSCLEQGRSLSIKQAAVLNSLWDRATARG